MTSIDAQHQQLSRAATHKLPGALSGILNAPEEQRDSAYFSANDASSKHTSATSIGMLSSGVSGYGSVHDKTPSPIAATTITHTQPLVSPTSNMTVASMVSPTTPASVDHRRLETSTSTAMNGSLEPDTRRESVESRINQNFGELMLGPNSPYTTNNHSATSIQSTLAQQRNPRPAYDSISNHRISNGYQPSADRTPDPHGKITRTAPAITGPTSGSIARGPEPVKGQAWAFPEEGAAAGAHANYIDSRRSSIADSLASSQYTTESRLPPGQRRLDDVSEELGGIANASAEFPALHHHTLQNRQLGDLKSEEAAAQGGSQPYSRTPELRVSHKLAERKRRTEMKELFEQLRDLMPQERGSKASKWEILTKAIQEHARNAETIRYWTSHCQRQQADIDSLRRELHSLRVDNDRMRNQAEAAGGGNRQMPAPAPSGPSYPPSDDAYSRQARPELPPLRAVSGGVQAGPESMTGVQYEGPRPPSSFPPPRAPPQY